MLDGAVKTARIWDRDATLRAILTGHGDKVHAVAIAPDGTWLATASDDYTARIGTRPDRLTRCAYRPCRQVVIAGQGQGRQDQIVPAQDDDLPFVLDVEDAFRITGRGTVIMGVIDPGTT